MVGRLCCSLCHCRWLLRVYHCVQGIDHIGKLLNVCTRYTCAQCMVKIKLALDCMELMDKAKEVLIDGQLTSHGRYAFLRCQNMIPSWKVTCGVYIGLKDRL